jgi:hypothetical protein
MKIKLVENNNGVHLTHPFSDTTLCGEADEGGVDMNEMTPIKETKKKRITCKHCLSIIEFCQDYILSLK